MLLTKKIMFSPRFFASYYMESMGWKTLAATSNLLSKEKPSHHPQPCFIKVLAYTIIITRIANSNLLKHPSPWSAHLNLIIMSRNRKRTYRQIADHWLSRCKTQHRSGIQNLDMKIRERKCQDMLTGFKLKQNIWIGYRGTGQFFVSQSSLLFSFL